MAIAAVCLLASLGLAVAFRRGLPTELRAPLADIVLNLPILNAFVAFIAAQRLGRAGASIAPWPIFWRDVLAWMVTWLAFATALHLSSHTTDGLWLSLWAPFAAVMAVLTASCLAWSRRARAGRDA